MLRYYRLMHVCAVNIGRFYFSRIGAFINFDGHIAIGIGISQVIEHTTLFVR